MTASLLLPLPCSPRFMCAHACTASLKIFKKKKKKPSSTWASSGRLLKSLRNLQLLILAAKGYEVHFPLSIGHQASQNCRIFPFAVQCSGVTAPDAFGDSWLCWLEADGGVLPVAGKSKRAGLLPRLRAVVRANGKGRWVPGARSELGLPPGCQP